MRVLVAILVIAVFLNCLVLAAVTVVGVLVVRRLDKTVSIAEKAIKEISEELPLTLKEAQCALKTARNTLKTVDTLAGKAAEELYRVDDILVNVDRLFKGAIVADTAVKTIGSTHSTAAGVLAGIKEALRVFRSPAGKSKEE